MCVVVYAGSDHPLPTWLWDQDRPSFHVTARNDPTDPVRQRFTKPFVYYLGSHEGCGCGFHYGPYAGGEIDPAVEPVVADSRRRLGEYLAVALQHQAEVEVYACWSGDEAEPPEFHDRASPSELASGEAYLRERELMIVSET